MLAATDLVVWRKNISSLDSIDKENNGFDSSA